MKKVYGAQTGVSLLCRQPEFDTIQLHGGQQPDPTTNARAVPIYASTSFVFNNSEVSAVKLLNVSLSDTAQSTVPIFLD